MYITRIPNRNSPPAVLLRESYREGGKVKSRTLANLSQLPDSQIELMRRVLKGEALVTADDAFEIVRSRLAEAQSQLPNAPAVVAAGAKGVRESTT